jgi:hypothetical protein
MQWGSAGVGKDSIGAMELIDTVRAGAKAAAWRIVLTGIEGLVDNGGVDDGIDWVSLTQSKRPAGEAEDAVTRLCGSANGGLADGERKQRALICARRRSAWGAATITGELIDVRSWRGRDGGAFYPVARPLPKR